MSTDVNTVIATWNAEHAAATAELVTLEATLKANYNAYVDSLCAYLNRLETVNEYRQSLYRSLTEHWERNSFGHSAEPPIENKAMNYLLDTINPAEVKSTTIVGACDSAVLMSKKAD